MTTFDYQKPTEEQLERIQSIREAFNLCEDTIVRSSKSKGREFALALTKIEEGCMWAIKGIVWAENRGNEEKRI